MGSFHIELRKRYLAHPSDACRARLAPSDSRQSHELKHIRDIRTSFAHGAQRTRHLFGRGNLAQAHRALSDSARAASETARAHSVSWWLVQAALAAAAVLLPEVDQLHIRRIGVDERRYRSVRYFRTPAGDWRRFEPWMSTVVNLDTGQVLGVVDGRDSAPIDAWLAERTQAWRDHIEVVAIDPSAAFRKALRQQLPHAAVSVDAFHLVKLANDAVTAVRQRVTREQHGRRGRLQDPSWRTGSCCCAAATRSPTPAWRGCSGSSTTTTPPKSSAQPGV